MTNERTRKKTENEDESSSEKTLDQCPECGGRVLQEDGERCCQNCALVLEEEVTDRGPEWRAFDPTEREANSRVGGGKTSTRLDDNLGGTVNTGSSRTIDKDEKRLDTREERLERTQRRTIKQGGKAETLSHGLGLIQSKGRALPPFSSAEIETAAKYFQKASKKNFLRGRDLDNVVAGSLWLASKKANFHMPIERILSGTNADDEQTVRKMARSLAIEQDLTQPIPDPREHVRWVISELEDQEEPTFSVLQRPAIGFIDALEDAGLRSGRSPRGIAAGAVYTAWTREETDSTPSQRAIADATDLCTDTICNRHQEIESIIDGDT